MSESYVIEVRPPRAGRTVQAGIVVRDGRGFTFFAATDDFHELERQSFKNPKAAEAAAMRHACDPRPRRLPLAANFQSLR